MSLDPLSDAELARRIAAGDDAAFDRLYGENVGRVHAVCLRMSGDATRARSLTQEAFVRAWQRIGSFRGESRLSSWLHRLTVNVVLESERSRRMLVLRDIEGHSYEEVAGLTGVALGTVKSQISRARRLVREMLEA